MLCLYTVCVYHAKTQSQRKEKFRAQTAKKKSGFYAKLLNKTLELWMSWRQIFVTLNENQVFDIEEKFSRHSGKDIFSHFAEPNASAMKTS